MYEDDFEDWEHEYELINSKDFEGLIVYRKSLLSKKPNDEELMLSLCDAQIMNSDYWEWNGKSSSNIKSSVY